MKQHKIKVLAGAVMFCFGSMAYAGVSTTKHNLSSTGTGDFKTAGTTEICVFCHTPHMTEAKGTALPLWNHTLQSAATNYGVYASDTFDGAGTAADTVASTTVDGSTVSTLCLSCHDGSIAVSSLMNGPNGSTITCDSTAADTGTDCILDANETTNLGNDLSNDHPVNFTYDGALETADGSLNDSTALTYGVLYGGKVQCASCHDPHESVNPTFLRGPMTDSTLCLDCHNK